MRLLFAFLTVLFTSACATQATLTVYSQPPGGYITEMRSGKVVGLAPVNTYYDGAALQGYKDAQGCYLVGGLEARWVSGARAATTESVRLCGGSTDSYNITLSRDTSSPGLEKDLQFAVQIQALQFQQQQAQAAQNAAAAALIGAFSAAQQTNAPVRCTSYPIGDTVHTTCK